ncbi:hypothetical protein HHX47_DHR8000172 [Lentinula edodes]|nr:hypothetical protein HHX47_DHR8000172 [Lentinula edodes]
MSASTSEGIALITGSSQGIGKAIAIRLASDGFEIAINDIPAKSLTLEATQKEIQELTGKRALICVGDVSVEEEVKGMIEEVVKSLGGIDVYAQMSAVGRIGNPADVANLVSFLASKHSEYLTGMCSS